MDGVPAPDVLPTALVCATGLFVAVQLARVEWRVFTAPRTDEVPFSNFARLARRWFGALLIVLLMVMLLLGVHAFDFRGRYGFFLGYWGAFLFLALALACVAIVDLLDTRRIFHLTRSQALREASERAADPPADSNG